MKQPETERKEADNAVKFSAHRLLMAQVAQDEVKSKTRSRRGQNGENIALATRLLVSEQEGDQNSKRKRKKAVTTAQKEVASTASTATVRRDATQPAAQMPVAVKRSDAPAILEEAKKTGEEIEESPDVLDAKAREEFEKAAAETAEKDRKYIVDKRTLICHFARCDRASEIPEKYQLKVAHIPFQGRIALCTNCFRDKTREQQLETYLKTCKPSSKNDVVSKAIVAYCEKLGIYAEAKAGVAYITTVAGEWYFTYNDRPIVLHHKNAEKRYDIHGNEKRDQYHIQKQRFYSPAHALAYIAIHDRPERALAIAVEQYRYMNRNSE